MVNLTEKEKVFVKAQLMDNGCGARVVEQLLDDNYSWADLKSIREFTGYSRHQVLGLISSLSIKEVIMLDDDKVFCISGAFLETLPLKTEFKDLFPEATLPSSFKI